MNVNKVISCAILLGLLSTAAFAQRGRLAGGGTMPSARQPNAVHNTQGVPTGNQGVPVNTAPRTQKTAGATPNAVGPRTEPNARPMPNHAGTPDAHDMGNATRVGPNQ
jgi:hypothetical protein